MFCVGPRRPGRDGAGYAVRSGNPLDDQTSKMNRSVRAERMFEQAHGAEDCQEIFEFWWVENRFFSKI